MLETCLQEAVCHSYILHLYFSGRYTDFTDFFGSVCALVSAGISKLHCGPNYPAVTTTDSCTHPSPEKTHCPVQKGSPDTSSQILHSKAQKPLVSATSLWRVEAQHSRAIRLQLLHFMETHSGTREKDYKGGVYWARANRNPRNRVLCLFLDM